MREAFLLLLLLLAALMGYGLFLHWVRRNRSRERIFEDDDTTRIQSSALASEPENGLARYLFLAGYRSREAPLLFLLTTSFCLLLGGGAACLIYWLDVTRPAFLLIERLPGGFWDIFVPMLYAAPPFIALAITCLPWMVVRSARHNRVSQVEQDLPITLELLATLAEAGIAFDAALERILSSQSPDRPLAQEFRTYQLELLAGRPRVQCLRRLSRRLNVPSFTTFISALVQAEQIGSGIAQVLRVQVEEFRSRRRERALRQAMALPVKLIFPLILCFLPGLFVAVLGPAFYQIFEFLDNFSPTRGL